MNILEKYLVEALEGFCKEIRVGNSHLDEKQLITLVDACSNIPFPNNKLSKEQCCQYLNVSRATFDNLVRDGEIPRGEKQQGFKELSWNKLDLDKLLYEKRKKYGSKQNKENRRVEKDKGTSTTIEC